MFFSAKALVTVISCALFALAQSSDNGTTTSTAPASTSTPDACILGCVTTAAAAASCTSIQDLTCLCESSVFQQSALACLQANCTAEDLQAALALQQQECGSLSSGVVSSTSGTLTGSTTASTPVVTTPSTSAPRSTSTSTGTSSGSGTGTGGAMALSAPFTFGGLVGLVGALGGAALVL